MMIYFLTSNHGQKSQQESGSGADETFSRVNLIATTPKGAALLVLCVVALSLLTFFIGFASERQDGISAGRLTASAAPRWAEPTDGPPPQHVEPSNWAKPGDKKPEPVIPREDAPAGGKGSDTAPPAAPGDPRPLDNPAPVGTPKPHLNPACPDKPAAAACEPETATIPAPADHPAPEPVVPKWAKPGDKKPDNAEP